MRNTRFKESERKHRRGSLPAISALRTMELRDWSPEERQKDVCRRRKAPRVRKN